MGAAPAGSLQIAVFAANVTSVGLRPRKPARQCNLDGFESNFLQSVLRGWNGIADTSNAVCRSPPRVSVQPPDASHGPLHYAGEFLTKFPRTAFPQPLFRFCSGEPR